MIASCHNEHILPTYRRAKRSFCITTLLESREAAQQLFYDGQYLEACDLYESMYVRFPEQAIEVLAEFYDLIQTLPKGVSRYELYQSRFFDFQLKPGDRVLDVGSGNDPFPLATHLADIALEDNAYGRAGVPLRRAGTKPIFECDLEDMRGFREKEFDFVYCSHVLEHVRNPAKACAELMRIGKRGFIETPTRGKDLWLGTAAVSNHRWAVEHVRNCLIFSEYESHEIDGLQCDLLLRMHVAPESRREKALTALMYLRADLVNTMLVWENAFAFEVRPAKNINSIPEEGKHIEGQSDDRWNDALPIGNVVNNLPHYLPNTAYSPSGRGKEETASHVSQKSCVFINTYYEAFLKQHYDTHPNLAMRSYQEQHASLQSACFGDSDFYSSNIRKAGWGAIDLIVNCRPLQAAWAKEQGITKEISPIAVAIEQIRSLRPQVLYLQDLGLATKQFCEAVRPSVELIIGQIASPIPLQAYLDGFDILISSFPHFVDEFRAQGRVAYYQPLAFDPRLLAGLEAGRRDLSVTFIGGLSPSHRDRQEFLAMLARSTPIQFWGYGTETLVQRGADASRCHGEAWGFDMFALLARSGITVNHHIDVAKSNANNMRLFEATGCGALLITDYKTNLSDLFEIGEEVVAYRSVEECMELIGYYLVHQDEASAIAKRGQVRTLRDHTYEIRMRHTAELLDRHLQLKLGSHRLPDPDLQQVSYGHVLIQPHQVTTDLAQSWRSDRIPLKQRALVQRELQDMYRGQPPVVFGVLADALRPHVRPQMQVMEVGCASGYYYEVLEYLLKTRIKYLGVDFSDAMIRLARSLYPGARFEVGDGGALRFEDRSIPVVVSSCVLLHVQEYALHIAEAARVASQIVVFHRTPIARRAETRHFKKYAYGVETLELRFNEAELLKICADAELELITQCTYSEHPERDEFDTTYVFRTGTERA